MKVVEIGQELKDLSQVEIEVKLDMTDVKDTPTKVDKRMTMKPNFKPYAANHIR